MHVSAADLITAYCEINDGAAETHKGLVRAVSYLSQLPMGEIKTRVALLFCRVAMHIDRNIKRLSSRVRGQQRGGIIGLCLGGD